MLWAELANCSHENFCSPILRVAITQNRREPHRNKRQFETRLIYLAWLQISRRRGDTDQRETLHDGIHRPMCPGCLLPFWRGAPRGSPNPKFAHPHMAGSLLCFADALVTTTTVETSVVAAVRSVNHCLLCAVDVYHVCACDFSSIVFLTNARVVA